MQRLIHHIPGLKKNIQTMEITTTVCLLGKTLPLIQTVTWVTIPKNMVGLLVMHMKTSLKVTFTTFERRAHNKPLKVGAVSGAA